MEFFANQSAKSNHAYSVTMARRSETEDSMSYIKGRSPYTFGKIDLSEYLTKSEAADTYTTPDEVSDIVESALLWIDV